MIPPLPVNYGQIRVSVNRVRICKPALAFYGGVGNAELLFAAITSSRAFCTAPDPYFAIANEFGVGYLLRGG